MSCAIWRVQFRCGAAVHHSALHSRHMSSKYTQSWGICQSIEDRPMWQGPDGLPVLLQLINITSLATNKPYGTYLRRYCWLPTILQLS
jgi:hypothetical protein